MRFTFSDEQEALRRAIRRFLRENCDARTIAERPGGFDRAIWQAASDELGLPALLVPEEHGGVGASFVELVAVMEELGHALAPLPFFSTAALAVPVLLLGGDEAQKQRWLPGIAEGRTIATLASPRLHPGRAREGIRARRTEAGYALDGQIAHVPDGHLADLLIVDARCDDATMLLLVPAETPGLARRALPTMDRTRRVATIEFTSVELPPDAALADGADASALLERVLDRAAVALAAEQVGGAARCLDMAVDYAKVRVQFGRPIGSFQAIKHRCADMFVRVESARSAAYYAGWAAAHADEAELPLAASTAKAVASEAFFFCAAENIQIHGGTGFTWDHDAHLFFKRARAGEALLGDPAWHRDRFARLAGIGVAP